MKSSKKIKQYESQFTYNKPILNITPKKWINYCNNELRIKTINKYKKFIQKDSKVLFVGIGKGDLLNYKFPEADYYGIDINKDWMEPVIKEGKAKCFVADAQDMPFQDNYFDIVICNLVLHHIIGQKTLVKSIKEIYRVLKKDGYMLSVEPSSYHLSGFLLNIINKYNLFGILFGGSNFEYAISPKKIKRLLTKKFNKVSIKGLTFTHPRYPIIINKIITKIENRLGLEHCIIKNFSWMMFIKCKK